LNACEEEEIIEIEISVRLDDKRCQAEASAVVDPNDQQ
jgi:hypothetical protein